MIKRLIQPILAQLKQGSSPEKLALSVAFGFTLGCFPVIGMTTGLCIAAGVAFKLNHAALQAANYGAYPIQILLIYPLLRLGRLLFGFAVSGWGWDILGTVFIWCLLAPGAIVILYYSSLPALRWAGARRGA